MKAVSSLIFLVMFTLMSVSARANESLMATGPVNTPSLSNEQILKWSGETLVNLYSFNYTNIDLILGNNHSYFTNDGFQSFQKSVKTGPWFQMIQRKKFDVLPVLDDTGVIKKQGIENGVYTWNIEIPLVLHLRGPFEMNKVKKKFLMVIKRAPLAEFSSGLAIVSIQSDDGSSDLE